MSTAKQINWVKILKYIGFYRQIKKTPVKRMFGFTNP